MLYRNFFILLSWDKPACAVLEKPVLRALGLGLRPLPSPTYTQMPQPTLPPELHHIILKIIGDEVFHAELFLHSMKGSVRGTLRACSLVSKAWHNSALPYVFHHARFFLTSGDRLPRRNAELFQLLEANPSIRRCIRRAEMFLDREVLPEDVEKVCDAISPIEEFTLVLRTCPPDLLRPSLDGLHPILSSPHLRDLSIWSTYLPLRLLKNTPNLRSLSLLSVDMVDMDHCHNGTWRSPTLEKLVVGNLWGFLNKIQGLGDHRTKVLAFFDCLKYLEMYSITYGVPGDNSWVVLLANWRRLETLVVHWDVTGESVSVPYLVLSLIKIHATFYRWHQVY